MVRNDHHGQEPDGPMAIALGYQLKSVERHRIPHEGHFRVAILRGLGVVEDALAVALQPPPGIVVGQLHTPVGQFAHVDVFDVGRIALSVGIAAAHFGSCDDAGRPCWTCVFPSKPEGDTHHECSDGQNGTPPAP